MLGESRYELDVVPAGPGKIISTGKGFLLRSTGEEVQLDVTETFDFDPDVSLPFEQFRVVDESGSLEGLTYSLVLHSVVDRYGAAVPTLTEWCLILIAMLLLTAGVLVLWKRKKAAAV